MRFCTIASSSRGNCSLICEGETKLLLDAGVSMRRINTALSAVGVRAEELTAILITHEHTDHTAGLTMLSRHYGLPIWASRATAMALWRKDSALEPLLHVFPAGGELDMGGLEVSSFRTPHDTPESVGYRVSDGHSAFAVATDLGCVTEAVRRGVEGCSTVLIETNHDPDMLWGGGYPDYLKRRIAGDCGHLSNADGAEFACRLAQTGTSRLLLAHLSRENNTPERAFSTVQEALRRALGGLDGLELAVAPKDGLGKVYII